MRATLIVAATLQATMPLAVNAQAAFDANKAAAAHTAAALRALDRLKAAASDGQSAGANCQLATWRQAEATYDSAMQDYNLHVNGADGARPGSSGYGRQQQDNSYIRTNVASPPTFPAYPYDKCAELQRQSWKPVSGPLPGGGGAVQPVNAVAIPPAPPPPVDKTLSAPIPRFCSIDERYKYYSSLFPTRDFLHAQANSWVDYYQTLTKLGLDNPGNAARIRPLADNALAESKIARKYAEDFDALMDRVRASPIVNCIETTTRALVMPGPIGAGGAPKPPLVPKAERGGLIMPNETGGSGNRLVVPGKSTPSPTPTPGLVCPSGQRLVTIGGIARCSGAAVPGTVR